MAPRSDRLVRSLASLRLATRAEHVFLHMVWLDFGHPGGVPAIVELLDTCDDKYLRDGLYEALRDA